MRIRPLWSSLQNDGAEREPQNAWKPAWMFVLRFVVFFCLKIYPLQIKASLRRVVAAPNANVSQILYRRHRRLALPTACRVAPARPQGSASPHHHATGRPCRNHPHRAPGALHGSTKPCPHPLQPTAPWDRAEHVPDRLQASIPPTARTGLSYITTMTKSEPIARLSARYPQLIPN